MGNRSIIKVEYLVAFFRFTEDETLFSHVCTVNTYYKLYGILGYYV